MNTIRNLFFVICGLIFFILTSCSNDNEKLESILKNCSVQYKLNDFVEIHRYYSKIITKNTEYIGFKEFSNSGYRLVTLVNTGKEYILSISFPGYKNATFYKEISSDVAQKLFNNLNYTSRSVNYKGDNSFHTICVLTVKRIEKTSTVTWMYNPPLVTSQQLNYKSNSLKIYAILKSLIENNFPDYNEKVLAITMPESKTIKIGKRFFMPDNYINATSKESETFVLKLLDSPFFEMSDLPD